MNIVAACVYIVCRQQNYPIMLIDISDKLAVNVYILGKVHPVQQYVLFRNIPQGWGTELSSSRNIKVMGWPSVCRPLLTCSIIYTVTFSTRIGVGVVLGHR